MPLYSYQCGCCGNTTEQVNSVAKRHTDAPICGKNATHGRMDKVLTKPMAYVRPDCHYVCPVTRSKVTTMRQRANIMSEHNLVDANDMKPEQGFARAEKEKAADQALIRELQKDSTTGRDRPFTAQQLASLLPSLETV